MRYAAKTIATLGLALGMMGAPPSQADVLLAESRTDVFVVDDGPPEAMPLDEDGNTELSFKTTKKGVVVITYNAECAASGPAGQWIGLEILVNGKKTYPKGSQTENAFCSSSGGPEIYTMVSRQAYIQLGKGTHTVQVLTSRQGISTGRIDDRSIVIMD